MKNVTAPLLLAISLVSACFPLALLDDQHYEKMCSDPNYAYESGYNAGLKRRPLDTGWVGEKCAPQVAQQVRERYQTGYQSGIANAPVVVPVGRTIAVTSQCTFSSDCGEGQSCRDRQCMGNGWTGDPCVFSSDCNSGTCDGRVCR